MTVRAKALTNFRTLTAALKRCATQNQSFLAVSEGDAPTLIAIDLPG
jgi:hypothetical protein